MLAMKDTGLVGGVPLEPTPLTAVKALRGFFDEQGAAHVAGDVVLCSERFARSLIASNKAERTAVAPVQDAPPTVAPAAPVSAPEPSAPEPPIHIKAESYRAKARRKERDED